MAWDMVPRIQWNVTSKSNHRRTARAHELSVGRWSVVGTGLVVCVPNGEAYTWRLGSGS